MVRRRLLIVGDSVMSRAERDLRAMRGWRVVVDARPCRQVARRVDGCGAKDIPSGVDAMHAGIRTVRPHAVVVHLGHNGRLTEDHFDTLMTAADVPIVIWLNLRQAQEWESSNNEVIEAGVARWPAARLLDWSAISEGKPWFQDDQLHLTRFGAAAMTQLVAEVLRGERKRRSSSTD